MGSRRTGKIRKMIRETSLRSIHHYYNCGECGHFFTEFFDVGRIKHENYCVKWLRAVRPTMEACTRFSRRISRRKGKKGNGLLAQKMAKWAQLASERTSYPHARTVSKVTAESAHFLPMRVGKKRKQGKGESKS